jgi:hypothetical protein
MINTLDQPDAPPFQSPPTLGCPILPHFLRKDGNARGGWPRSLAPFLIHNEGAPGPSHLGTGDGSARTLRQKIPSEMS